MPAHTILAIIAICFSTASVVLATINIRRSQRK